MGVGGHGLSYGVWRRTMSNNQIHRVTEFKRVPRTTSSHHHRYMLQARVLVLAYGDHRCIDVERVRNQYIHGTTYHIMCVPTRVRWQ